MFLGDSSLSVQLESRNGKFFLLSSVGVLGSEGPLGMASGNFFSSVFLLMNLGILSFSFFAIPEIVLSFCLLTSWLSGLLSPCLGVKIILGLGVGCFGVLSFGLSLIGVP